MRKYNDRRRSRPAAVYSWSAKASKGLVRVWARAVPCSVKAEGLFLLKRGLNNLPQIKIKIRKILTQ